MAQHNEVGRWGEEIACATLVRQGYAILNRNWRSGHYELDIVAQNGSRVIFVEVRTRSRSDMDPVESVDKRKRQRIIRSADAYIRLYDLPLEPQFDIIAIVGTPEKFNVEHIPDAFFPTLKTYR